MHTYYLNTEAGIIHLSNGNHRLSVKVNAEDMDFIQAFTRGANCDSKHTYEMRKATKEERVAAMGEIVKKQLEE